MMEQPAARRSTPIAAILLLIAGVVTLVGGLVSWGTAAVVAGGQRLPVKITGHVVAIGSGAILIVLGILYFLVKSRGGRIALGVLGLLFALGAVIVGAVFAGSKTAYESAFAKICADNPTTCGQGQTASQIEKELKAGIASGQLTFDVSRGAGVYIALVGGLLGLAGGVVGVAKAASGQPAPAPGAAGWPQAPGAGPPPEWGTPPGPPSGPPEPPPPPEPAPPPEGGGYSG